MMYAGYIAPRTPTQPLQDKEKKALREVIYGVDIIRYLEEHLGYRLFPWQTAVLSDRSRRISVDGARQGGKSTITSAKVAHKAKYKAGSLSVILAPTLIQSQETMRKVKDFIALDPTYPELVRSASDTVELSNGSRILVLPATERTARGFSRPDIILFDEASRIEDEVYDAVRPMINNSPRSEIIEISTPYGKKGFFYRHFCDPDRARYLVRSPYEPRITMDRPVLDRITPEDALQSIRSDLPESAAPENIHIFFSPQHESEKDQAEAMGDLMVNGYRQEMGCSFVESDDAAFSLSLIDDMFGASADTWALDKEEGMEKDMDYGEQDEEFRMEYEAMKDDMEASGWR